MIAPFILFHVMTCCLLYHVNKMKCKHRMIVLIFRKYFNNGWIN